MEVTLVEVFELNRVLHKLLEQQSSYKILTAFKIHKLIKWLDETEKFIFERTHMMGLSISDERLLSSLIPFAETDLTFNELLITENDVKLDVNDVGILEKFFLKAED